MKRHYQIEFHCEPGVFHDVYVERLDDGTYIIDDNDCTNTIRETESIRAINGVYEEVSKIYCFDKAGHRHLRWSDSEENQNPATESDPHGIDPKNAMKINYKIRRHSKPNVLQDIYLQYLEDENYLITDRSVSRNVKARSWREAIIKTFDDVSAIYTVDNDGYAFIAWLDDKPESDPHGLKPDEPGAKLDSGKIQAALLLDFNRAFLAVAAVSTYGAEKYSRGGWQSVPDGKHRYQSAMLRHLLAGGGVDPESRLSHAAHTAWNALAVLELELRQSENPDGQAR